MPTLLEQLQSVTGGSSVLGDVSTSAGQFLQIAQLVEGFVENPPDDVGGYLSHLQALALPTISVGADLGQVFNGLLPDLQGQLGGLLEPLSNAASGIQGGLGGDLANAIGPLLEAASNLQALLASDWSCGLIPAFTPPSAPAPAPGGSGSESPGSSPNTAASSATAVLSAEQVGQAKAVLDSLPPEMTAPALLKWLHARVGTFRPLGLGIRFIPFVDDLRDPLDTLVRWDGQTGVELATELNQTLGMLAAVVENNSSAILTSAFTPSSVQAIPSTAFATAGGNLVGALNDLRAAVQAGNAADAATHLASAQSAATDLEAANALLDAQAEAVDGLMLGVRDLPSALETAICRLLVLAQPRAVLGDVIARFGAELPLATDDTFQPLAEALGKAQEFFDNLLGSIDIAAVTEPIADVLDRVANAIDQVEQLLAQLTAGARTLFEQAHDALGALDAETVVAQAEQALQGAIDQVRQALAQGLAPAAEALSTALGAIDGALEAFDPEVLTEPVKQVIDGIKGVLEGPEFQQIQQALEQLKAFANKVKDFSFQPVTDVVVDGIGTVKSALESIDENNLPPPMPDMIAGAMSVLPESLTPVIDPLISGLDEIIDEGPTPVLETLRDLPKPVVEHLQNFSPRELLEEPLGTPFRELRQKLEEFEPTHWLDVLEEELDNFKHRIVDSLDLQSILAPLAQAYQALVDELARFRPGAVLQPLAQQLEEAVKAVVGAVPTTDIMLGLDQVLARVRAFTLTLDQVVEIGQAFAQKIEELSDPRAQLDEWLGDILAKLPPGAPAALGASLTSLSEAVNATRADALKATFTTARSPLEAKLTEVRPAALLAGLLQGKSRLSPALLDAFPASSTKTDLTDWLATFDPAGPTLSRGLRRLASVQDILTRSEADVQTLFGDWDARYHRADGPLAVLVHDSVTVDDLRLWLRQAVDRQLGVPVVNFLNQVRSLGKLLATFTQTVTNVLGVVNGKLNALLAVPEALSHIAHELDELKGVIQNLDLEVFGREVDSLYEDLLNKLRALDPRSFEEPLRRSLERLLDTVSLDAVVTPGLRADLTKTYQDLTAKVDAIDPELLVIGPLDDLYKKDILPFADALDISDAIQMIIDRLDALPDDLKTELDRVNTAYQAMLNAAPTGGGASAGGSVGL